MFQLEFAYQGIRVPDCKKQYIESESMMYECSLTESKFNNKIQNPNIYEQITKNGEGMIYNRTESK